MNIHETIQKLKSGEITSEALVKKSIETFEADKNSALPLNAFLEMYDDAISLAQAADAEISAARKDGSLDALFEKSRFWDCRSPTRIIFLCEENASLALRKFSKAMSRLMMPL